MTELLFVNAPTKSITRFVEDTPVNLDFNEAELDTFVADLNLKFHNSLNYRLKFTSVFNKIIIATPDISTDNDVISYLNIPISTTSRIKPNTSSLNYITNFLIV